MPSQNDQPIISNNDDHHKPDDDSDVLHTQYEVHHNYDERRNTSLNYTMLSREQDTIINIIKATKTTRSGRTSSEPVCCFQYKLNASIARQIEQVHADEDRQGKSLSMRSKGLAMRRARITRKGRVLFPQL